jgi:hypothetical protein
MRWIIEKLANIDIHSRILIVAALCRGQGAGGRLDDTADELACAYVSVLELARARESVTILAASAEFIGASFVGVGAQKSAIGSCGRVFAFCRDRLANAGAVDMSWFATPWSLDDNGSVFSPKLGGEMRTLVKFEATGRPIADR